MSKKTKDTSKKGLIKLLSILILLLISLIIVIPVFLYVYGYQQGQTLGERDASKLPIEVLTRSLNPLSQIGFRLGYQSSITEKDKVEKWRKEHLGPWTEYKSKDKITDFENYYLENKGDIGPNSKKASLKLHCLNDKTEIYVNWGSYLSAEQIEVIHRVDSKQYKKTNWSVSSDKKSFFYSGNKVSFIKSLIGHERLILRFEGRNTKTLSFDLNKLGTKIKPLAQACHWKV